LAVPIKTLKRQTSKQDIDELTALIEEYEPLEVVVGLPVTLSGQAGQAVEAALSYAYDLRDRLAGNQMRVPIRLIDERMSTMQATRQLQAAGRDSRQGRNVIDQAAAVIIVQQAVDQERATGVPPGRMLDIDAD
jgi:putative Holliday junction resolvase